MTKTRNEHKEMENVFTFLSATFEEKYTSSWSTFRSFPCLKQLAKSSHKIETFVYRHFCIDFCIYIFYKKVNFYATKDPWVK